MGIRFQCHLCGHSLHVKDFQAGRKGRCPECKGQFRIPLSDAQFSLDPKVNQSAADSAITSAASANTASIATSSLATADAITQLTPSLRTTTNRSASAHSASLPKDSLTNQTRSNYSLLEERSVPDPEMDLQVPTATESVKYSESPLSPADVSQQLQPSQQGDHGMIQPKVIAEAPAATWYVRPAAGGQYGPAPTEVMWQWLIEGRVGVDSLVWRDDWPEWHPANQVFAEFFDKMLAESVSNPIASASTSSTQFGYASAESITPAYSEPQAANFAAQQSLPVATDSIDTIDSQLPVAGATSIVASRVARQRSRRVKYSVAIAILVMLLLGLGVGLVIVLYKQGVTP